MPTTTCNQHPEYERIAPAAKRLFQSRVGVRLHSTVYRAVHPKYSELPDLISGEGSRLKGSRWSAPGAMRVLHASDSPEHAISEALANYRHFGIPIPRDLHIVVRAIQVEIRHVLDLCDGNVRRILHVSEDRMLDTNWRHENASNLEAVSQAVGRAAADAGFHGLIVRSRAADGAINTVVFVDRMGSQDHMSMEKAD